MATVGVGVLREEWTTENQNYHGWCREPTLTGSSPAFRAPSVLIALPPAVTVVLLLSRLCGRLGEYGESEGAPAADGSGEWGYWVGPGRGRVGIAGPRGAALARVPKQRTSRATALYAGGAAHEPSWDPTGRRQRRVPPTRGISAGGVSGLYKPAAAVNLVGSLELVSRLVVLVGQGARCKCQFTRLLTVLVGLLTKQFELSFCSSWLVYLWIFAQTYNVR